MPIDWEVPIAAGIKGIMDGIAMWLMDDSEDEDKRLELTAQLDRERRRMPDWAYERLQGLLTGPVMPGATGISGAGAPSPPGGAGASAGAFQRVLGGGGGVGAPEAPGGISAPPSGIQPRLSPQLPTSMRQPPRNPQLRTFLGRR